MTGPSLQVDGLIFREFAFASTEYQASLQLREQVLRQPLGLRLSAEDTATDADQRHFGAFAAAQPELPLAVLVLKPVAEALPRPPCGVLRQMAVAEPHRGGGIGRRLLACAESAAWDMGCPRIELAARVAVAGFYLRCGYQPESAVYLAVGIPHQRMVKLSP